MSRKQDWGKTATGICHVLIFLLCSYPFPDKSNVNWHRVRLPLDIVFLRFPCKIGGKNSWKTNLLFRPSIGLLHTVLGVSYIAGKIFKNTIWKIFMRPSNLLHPIVLVDYEKKTEFNVPFSTTASFKALFTIYIQGVPRVKVTTSGECSLC